MTDDALTAAKTDDGNDDDGSGGLQRFVMILSFVFVLFIMFDNELRLATGDAVGTVLNPIIGFDHAWPLWTLVLAGITMIVISTAVRHLFIDWMEMARVQEVMREFQREFREAQKQDNNYKVKRLTEMQPKVMQMQAELSGSQLKPMAFTMLVVIPIFAWLLQFVASLPDAGAVVRMPWTDSWSLKGQFWIIPRWILIYSLFSIPMGQLTQRVLKLWDYKVKHDPEAT